MRFCLYSPCFEWMNICIVAIYNMSKIPPRILISVGDLPNQVEAFLWCNIMKWINEHQYSLTWMHHIYPWLKHYRVKSYIDNYSKFYLEETLSKSIYHDKCMRFVQNNNT